MTSAGFMPNRPPKKALVADQVKLGLGNRPSSRWSQGMVSLRPYRKGSSSVPGLGDISLFDCRSASVVAYAMARFPAKIQRSAFVITSA
jgi:hypothetical protein